MNKAIVSIIGLIAIALIVYYLRKKKPPMLMVGDGIFIAPEGVGNERIRKLKLDKPSEDASHILDKARLSFPQLKRNLENREYKANPDREWIIKLELANGGVFTKTDLLQVFDLPWRQNYHSTIYGYSPEEGRWAYAFAGGTPEIYERIEIGINLLDVFNEEEPDYDPSKLERYLVELERIVKKYPSKLRFAALETVPDAILKARKWVELNHAFDKDAIIVLKSERVFEGLKAWDALLCVGLKWGDGDLFHWTNYDSDYGHDRHFSVWTTTAPGYFLPERIKSRQMNPGDLVFGFSIPRCADPLNVFAVMIEAVKYCQKNIGGIILDSGGNRFHEGRELEALSELVKKMEIKGIKPGSEDALRIY